MNRAISEDPFHASAAKRALGYFIVGKVLAGLTGFGFLVYAARGLATNDYGAYVSLVAILEITLLTTNLGAYPIAQRYVTEARLPANLPQLPVLVWATAAYRAATLLVACVLLGSLGGGGLQWMKLANAAMLLPVYAVVIGFEGFARYLDLVLESLLQQRLAQASALFRNIARLSAVAWATHFNQGLELATLVHIELACSTLGALFVMVLMWRLMHRLVPSEVAKQAQPLDWRRMWAFAMPLTAAQVLSQLYSPDAIKFVIARLLGVVEVAAFGLAHSLSAMVQRYLPAQMLLGWLRPLLVSRHASGASGHELVATGNLILKLNHFLLVPAIVWVAVEAPTLVLLVSGGKAPSAAPLLSGLMALLILQALHVVLSMLATSIEDRRGVLLGILISVPGIGLGIWLTSSLGAIGMVLGLWASEAAYCVVTTLSLRRCGLPFMIDWPAWGRIGLAAGLPGGVIAATQGPATTVAGLSVHALIFALAYLLLSRALRPFKAHERARVNRMLPRPWFVF